MESDPNPFPKMHLELLPRCGRIFHFIFDHLQSPGLSSHNTGGGPMLDRELYDGPEQVEVGRGTLPE